MNEKFVLDYLELIKELHKDFLRCLMEMNGMMGEEEDGEEEGMLMEPSGEDFPPVQSYSEEDISYTDPAYASGVSLGIPKSAAINNKEEE